MEDLYKSKYAPSPPSQGPSEPAKTEPEADTSNPERPAGEVRQDLNDLSDEPRVRESLSNLIANEEGYLSTYHIQTLKIRTVLADFERQLKAAEEHDDKAAFDDLFERVTKAAEGFTPLPSRSVILILRSQMC